MKKSVSTHHTELVDIPPFDFERSRPNPYAERYDEDAEVIIHASREECSIILEPDVAEYFPDSESVNAALRALISALSRIKNPNLSPSLLKDR